MDTTPAAYGQLTMARFTSEEANRKGPSGDQTTGPLLRLGRLLRDNRQVFSWKRAGPKPGLHGGSALTQSQSSRPALSGGCDRSLIPPR